MREVALGRVVDDVLERDVERLAAELHREDLVRIGRASSSRKAGSIVAGSLPTSAGERGALGAVALAGRAEAAEQIDLQRRRLGELSLPAAWCSAGRSRR